jgi:hypothetical protein
MRYNKIKWTQTILQKKIVCMQPTKQFPQYMVCPSKAEVAVKNVTMSLFIT